MDCPLLLPYPAWTYPSSFSPKLLRSTGLSIQNNSNRGIYILEVGGLGVGRSFSISSSSEVVSISMTSLGTNLVPSPTRSSSSSINQTVCLSLPFPFLPGVEDDGWSSRGTEDDINDWKADRRDRLAGGVDSEGGGGRFDGVFVLSKAR